VLAYRLGGTTHSDTASSRGEFTYWKHNGSGDASERI